MRGAGAPRGALCVDARGVLVTPTRRKLYQLRLHLPCGAAALVYGPNGSGKTLLLRVLAGLEKKKLLQGAMEIAKPLVYTPAENLYLPGTRVGEWFWLHATKPIKTLIEHRKTPLDNLSRGWSRLAQLAAPLTRPKPPRVYLLDEPLAGMDEERATQLAHLIARAAEQGSLVITTAPSSEAERAAKLLGNMLQEKLYTCPIEAGVLNCGSKNA